MPPTRNELAEAALAYANRGWRVIALHFINVNKNNACSCMRGPECKAPGKHPMFKKWREVATSNPVNLRAWWKAWPLANVGLTMGGQASLVTIDIDGDAGRESLATLEGLHAKLPPTLTQSTGRKGGGEHRLFHVDPFYVDWIRNRAHVAPSIDIRAEGGLIVAAPSLHSSGARYCWHDPNHAIAELPKWLFDLALSKREQQRVFSPSGARPAEEELEKAGWPLKKRIAAAKLALPMAPPAIQGQNGSRDCLRAAFLLVRGFCIPPTEAFDMLWSDYNPRCVPMWDHDELFHKVTDAEITLTNVPWKYKLDAVVDYETMGSLDEQAMQEQAVQRDLMLNQKVQHSKDFEVSAHTHAVARSHVSLAPTSELADVTPDIIVQLPSGIPQPPTHDIRSMWHPKDVLRGDTRGSKRVRRADRMRLREEALALPLQPLPLDPDDEEE